MRLRDWMRRDRLDAELDEELAFHRAQLERDAVAAGATTDEAAWTARRRLGNTRRVKGDSRARWAIPALDQFAQDVRYAVRGLRRSPGLTAGVVITLALGLGANTAMFGVVDRLLFRAPALLRDPDTAHRVYGFRTRRGTEEVGGVDQYARYRDIERWTHSFSAVAGFAPRELVVGTGDDAREMRVAVVSPSFFGFFEAPPVLGRYFTEAESKPGEAPVAVLSHGMWQTHYGGRHDVVGTALQIGSATYTIIGVAPRGFVGLWEERPPAAFISLTDYAANESKVGGAVWTTYSWGWMSTIVRRKPNVTLAAANADLTNALVRSYEAERLEDPSAPPLAATRPHAVAGSIIEQRGPRSSSDTKVATWVGGVSVIVLLISCANVANLLLARALRRRREIALRVALGVTRRRLLGQLLTESIVLAALGGVVGLGVAHWGGAALRAFLLEKNEAPAGIFDARTVWFAAAAALVVGLLTGLAPLVQATRAQLTSDLRAGARDGSYRSSHTRTALLIGQAALSATLLVGAMLFVRSLRNVEQFRLGYDTDPVLIVGMNARGVALDSARMVALRHRLLDAAKSVPGVESASLQSSVPFWNTRSYQLFVEGIDSVARLGRFRYNSVSPEHFATLGTRVLRGRGVTDEDTPTSPPVMVVSEAMGRALWPGRDPIGQCVRLRFPTAPCRRVVGVTENIQQEDLGEDPGYYYHLPAAQASPQVGGLFVRARGDGRGLRETVRVRLQREMPGAAYVTVTPFSEIVGSEKRSWRLGATMFTAFGALALVIAAVGFYSVIAYDVAQRSHELSVRVALGARARDITRVVVEQGVRFAVAGIALGLGIALLGAQRLQPLLFKQSATDPSVYAGVGVILLVAAIAACVAPARRAVRADPSIALRAD
ncbi:MAG TPA: ADOP family duplicated permease [Gemmatimonadaceae bacterium]|nr:ADOP family duplicated permease [Gemmatimonadaceae bacterium]